jgi:hypothetical protein
VRDNQQRRQIIKQRSKIYEVKEKSSNEFSFSISSIQRVTSCELEYDVHINDISNEPPQIG